MPQNDSPREMVASTEASIGTVPASRSSKVGVLVGCAAQCAVLGAQLRGARLCAPLHRRHVWGGEKERFLKATLPITLTICVKIH